MFAFLPAYGTTAWSVISRSSQIRAGVKEARHCIRCLVNPGSLVKLERKAEATLRDLLRETQCLIQPVNFLLIWSTQRNSCVQEVMLSAQELICEIHSFVKGYMSLDEILGVGIFASPDGKIDEQTLEEYRSRLHSTTLSVTCAVGAINASEKSLLVQASMDSGRVTRNADIPSGQAATATLNRSSLGTWQRFSRRLSARSSGAANSSPSRTAAASHFSPSALVRASVRIQEMGQGSGDLCALRGRLYSRVVQPARKAELQTEGGDCTAGPSDLVDENAHEDAGSWKPVLLSAAFKITSDARASALQFGSGRYGISIENKSPLTSDESKAEDGLNFPIDVAMDANLVTMGDLALPLSDPAYGIGLDSVVLVWRGSPCAWVSGPGREENEDLVEWTIAEEVGLPATEDVLADVSNQDAEHVCYAFAFDIARDRVEAGIDDLAMTFTPLDALHLARLCAYDGTMRTRQGSLPAHLCTSDEILAELLMTDGVVDSSGLPTQRQATPEGVHTKSC
eukprot:TRINITY_DN43782_c0_g1_i1.p1 TRINITY_DN43782_c0_g1~~TRINITY_DN43782_c0_g1_i1.p1  ORF type:complete len:511 (+),score=63.62 TRINITY_DN43782_c0_g1_i1:134-1666(+)